LVVVDSIAFHFRQEFDQPAKRTRLLNGMAQDFQALAARFNLAVRIDFDSLECLSDIIEGCSRQPNDNKGREH
jgi:hypothetical protein